MPIARRNLASRLGTELRARVGTFPSAPGPEHDTEQYRTDLRLNTRHAELLSEGLDWMAARRQARQEIEEEG
jgi:hypothetical protein